MLEKGHEIEYSMQVLKYRKCYKFIISENVNIL
jgi:hypothetical protein